MEMLSQDVKDATRKKFFSEMVEATEFPHLAQKYHVFGLPRTVINRSTFIEGAVPEAVFLDYVLKTVGPERR